MIISVKNPAFSCSLLGSLRAQKLFQNNLYFQQPGVRVSAAVLPRLLIFEHWLHSSSHTHCLLLNDGLTTIFVLVHHNAVVIIYPDFLVPISPNFVDSLYYYVYTQAGVFTDSGYLIPWCKLRVTNDSNIQNPRFPPNIQNNIKTQLDIRIMWWLSRMNIKCEGWSAVSVDGDKHC